VWKEAGELELGQGGWAAPRAARCLQRSRLPLPLTCRLPLGPGLATPPAVSTMAKRPELPPAAAKADSSAAVAATTSASGTRRLSLRDARCGLMGLLQAKSVLKLLAPTVCRMAPPRPPRASPPSTSLRLPPGADAQTRATKRESESAG
jgi:hypothetical protein